MPSQYQKTHFHPEAARYNGRHVTAACRSISRNNGRAQAVFAVTADRERVTCAVCLKALAKKAGAK